MRKAAEAFFPRRSGKNCDDPIPPLLSYHGWMNLMSAAMALHGGRALMKLVSLVGGHLFVNKCLLHFRNCRAFIVLQWTHCRPRICSPIQFDSFCQ
uniref:Uncharacterized protein n=1 Tax=Setaria viridis TaxID=4556 RepID=A0A4U6TWJ4_SETVI|nr:hypothetical protein SEVIR_7G215900v2 [Setaria viridis]